MTSQSKKNEFKKTSKKIFAPPVVKSYCVPFGKGELELHGKEEDGVTVKSINISPTQSKRQKKNMSNAEKKSQCKKNLETIKNEKGSLTDAQFEEIVQSVLQKSLQECMEKFKERVVSAESTEGQHPRREAFLAVEGNDLGKKTEVMLSEVERREHQFGMKKQSKFCVNKDEKKINEKAEANNVGCKENRKGEPKKTVQGNAQDVTDQEETREEEEEEEEEADGGSGSSSWCTAWAQCSYPNCEKWRRLRSDVDPSVLPEDWSCSQNPDLQYNSCSVPEETWSGSENEVVYAIYFPGSIVWAKQYGYPWWPGIIEADPDIEEYFLFSSQADSLPSKYHVTFFGNSVTRAWISASLLKNFGEPPGEGNASAKLRNKGEKKNLKVALEMAKEAEQMGIQERIRRFGFHSRFKDKESPKDYKTLKDHSNVTRRPWAKRTQETRGGEKNTGTSSKNQEKLLHEISVVKPNANIKTTLNMKGFKKSSSAPQCETTQARRLNSCPDNSTAKLAFSSYPSKKDSLNKSEGSPRAQRKWMPRKGAVGEAKETLRLETGEEETLSSSEMAVSAEEEEEEEDHSSEDFSLAFFEE